jgi:serine/threonine protein kinase
MGEVFIAEDLTLHRKAAIKFLPRKFTLEADRLRRFEQEARAASALNHPNIITIYEIEEWDDTHFIASEFIEGETLNEKVQKTRLPVEEVLDIGCQTAGALAAAHAAGIVHRDISRPTSCCAGMATPKSSISASQNYSRNWRRTRRNKL